MHDKIYIQKFQHMHGKKNESNKVAPCGDLWPQATTACPQDQNKIHGRSGENIFLHSAGAEPPNVRTKNGKNHAWMGLRHRNAHALSTGILKCPRAV